MSKCYLNNKLSGKRKNLWFYRSRFPSLCTFRNVGRAKEEKKSDVDDNGAPLNSICTHTWRSSHHFFSSSFFVCAKKRHCHDSPLCFFPLAHFAHINWKNSRWKMMFYGSVIVYPWSKWTLTRSNGKNFR